MTVPPAVAWKVELGVPPTGDMSGTYWMIEDSPQGAVDSSYVVAPDLVYTDVSTDMVSLDTARTRSWPLDRTEAGTATITLRNDNAFTAGQYDETDGGAPFWGMLGPDAWVRVSLEAEPVFCGPVDDIQQADEQGDQVVTTITARTPEVMLAKKIAYTPEQFHTAAERLHRILETCGCSMLGESFATGINVYQRGILQEGDALDMVNDVAFSEGGLFYASKDGETFVFVARSTLEAATPTLTFTDGSIAGFEYASLARSNGRDQVVNSATFKSMHDPAYVVGSVDDHRIEDMPLQEFTTPIGWVSKAATVPFIQARVDQIVADYATPQFRFESATVQGRRYSAAQRVTLAQIEMGDAVIFDRLPPSLGALVRDCTVIGVAWHGETQTADLTLTVINQPT